MAEICFQQIKKLPTNNNKNNLALFHSATFWNSNSLTQTYLLVLLLCYSDIQLKRK